MSESKARSWNRLNTIFLTGTLTAALIAVPLYLVFGGFHWAEWITCAAMVFGIGTAISAGYHRLFSHRAFKASLPVRFLLLVFGAASFENSALKWASDHRIHHHHVDDEDKDPYAIGKGFWFAHWTWVMEAKELPLQGVADLERDPLLRWQHRNHFLIGAVVASAPLWIGLAMGRFWGFAIVAVLLRIVLTHHSTFLINSAAHVFGSRPYSEASSARDNWVLAPLTYGEGYHNFHHTWQWDYRNGHRWYHWDSTKWILNGLRWTGLVHGFRSVPGAAIERARLEVEAVRLRRSLENHAPSIAHPLQERLAHARLQLDLSLAALHECRMGLKAKRAEWRAEWKAKGLARKARKQERAEAWRQARAEWKAVLAHHRQQLKEAWIEWKAARSAARSALVYA
ncbi:MAG TPA: acyl-CoA desaturase [Holophagaceae bacterium]|jgi:stearoyl-CoA desaturase (delta-9 desaturase)|nr:acyl-CoA desaturase [Holophagaceae bacterium]